MKPVGTITKRMREAYDLRVNQGKAYLDIASRFGVSITSVKVWIARVKREPVESGLPTIALEPIDPTFPHRQAVVIRLIDEPSHAWVGFLADLGAPVVFPKHSWKLLSTTRKP